MIYLMDQNRIRKILDHNSSIIEDNLCYGYKTQTPKAEIDQYYKDAKREQRLLKAHIQTGGDVEWDKTTQLWVVKH